MILHERIYRECECDEYKQDIDSYNDWNFCPWCGSKMIDTPIPD